MCPNKIKLVFTHGSSVGQFSSGSLLILPHISNALLMGCVMRAPPLQLHRKASLLSWDFGLLEKGHRQPSRQEQLLPKVATDD